MVLEKQTQDELLYEIKSLQQRVKALEESEADLKRNQEKLQASEDLLNSILQNSPNVFLAKDLDSRYILINRRYEEVFKLEPGWLNGKDDFALFPEEVAEYCRAHDRSVIETAMPVAYEIQVIQDDKVHTYFETKFPIFNKQGKPQGLAAISIDITQLKEAEEALRKRDAEFRQAQKLETIGRITGGIAHDFNNLLTVIFGYSELLLEKLVNGSEMLDLPETIQTVAQIKYVAERSAKLVQQLMVFSRQQVLKPEVLNLNSVLVDSQEMLKCLLNEDIEFKLALDQDLRNVRADKIQIEQVLVNLAINARDAMPFGGKLDIRTTNVSEYVKIAVSDNGHGMDEETKGRIFEPFFTTKPPSKGTGLGLSTVYGIVKQNGGMIEVFSVEGVGTTFEIYLPIVAEAVPKTIKPDLITAFMRGTETVLVVEDEEFIRRLVNNVLTRFGYTVLLADRPEQALKILQANKDRIDLLITDMIMPDMTGVSLANEMWKVLPDVPVIYMSGYTDEEIVGRGLLEHIESFLQKPFNVESLLATVRQALNNDQTGMKD